MTNGPKMIFDQKWLSGYVFRRLLSVSDDGRILGILVPKSLDQPVRGDPIRSMLISASREADSIRNDHESSLR